MAKLALNIVKKIVEVVPQEETYFIKKEIPNIKLNKDIIKLNYGALSPFEKGDIIFYKDKNSLYIWFTKNPIESKKIHIPEGFLLYRQCKVNEDAIVIRKIEDNNYSVVVVKNGIIAAQFSKVTITDKFIEMIKKEHSLKNPTVKKIENDIKIKNIEIEDILRFANSVNINFKSVALNVYKQLKIPAIVFFVLLNILEFSTYKYITSMINERRIELKKIENSNKQIKKRFNFLEKEANFFRKFENSELKYPNIYSVLSIITDSIAKNNSTVKIYRQSYGSIYLWVVSDSISSVVNSLLSTGYFDDVKVINISQSYQHKTKEIGKLEMKIKAVKYGR